MPRLPRLCSRLFAAVVALIGSVLLAAPAMADEVVGDPVARLGELVNGERADAGLPPLLIDGALDDEGAAHSARMAAAGDIFHNDDLFTREAKDRLGAKTIGENVASNSSIDDAHRRLMASEGHRANILSGAFDRLGLGVAQVGSTWYVTEVFVQSRPAALPAPAPAPAPEQAVASPPPPPATTSPARPASPTLPAPTTTAPAPVPDVAEAAPAAEGGTAISIEVVAADPIEVQAAAVSPGNPVPAVASSGVLTSTALGSLASTIAAALLVVATAGSVTRRILGFS